MAITAQQQNGIFQGSANVVYQNLVGSPTAGDIWADFANVSLKMWSGSEWTTFSNATGDITGVVAGNGLSGGGLSGTVTLDLDFSELTDMTGAISGSTELILLDGATESRKAASEIDLSAFNNDSGWTANTGDITEVVAGDGLTGGATSGSATLNIGAGTGITVNADDISITATGTATGSFGDAATVSTFTVNAQGQLTSAGETAIAIGISQVSGATLDAVTTNGNTTTNDITVGNLTSTGIDDNATSTAITIDSSQNVGVGTNTIAAEARMIVDGGRFYINSDDQFGLLLQNAGTSGGFIGTAAENTLNFYNSAGSERMRIDSSGDLIMNGGAIQTTTLTSGSNATAGTITGDWTLTAGSTWQATYADLAEKYTTDSDYEPGTVMKFGGTAELTQSDTANDHRVAGVVSTNPAYILNADIEGLYLALSGRVPVKVTGSVSPGDILVSSSVPGHAEVNNVAISGRIIGKAITSDANGVCEALVTLM